MKGVETLSHTLIQVWFKRFQEDEGLNRPKRNPILFVALETKFSTGAVRRTVLSDLKPKRTLFSSTSLDRGTEKDLTVQKWKPSCQPLRISQFPLLLSRKINMKCCASSSLAQYSPFFLPSFASDARQVKQSSRQASKHSCSLRVNAFCFVKQAFRLAGCHSGSAASDCGIWHLLC